MTTFPTKTSMHNTLHFIIEWSSWEKELHYYRDGPMYVGEHECSQEEAWSVRKLKVGHVKVFGSTAYI